MLRWLIGLIVTVLGVRIFLFNGKREELNSIKEHKIMSVNDHAIIFNFYEKLQTNNIIRFGRLHKSVYRFYIIEAVFSEGFSTEFKNQNEKKYYIDFKYHWWYNTDIVLDILLEKFVVYLQKQYLESTESK